MGVCVVPGFAAPVFGFVPAVVLGGVFAPVFAVVLAPEVLPGVGFGFAADAVLLAAACLTGGVAVCVNAGMSASPNSVNIAKILIKFRSPFPK